MKKIYLLLVLILLLSFQTVSAQSGTCGNNVIYTTSGSTISFSKDSSSETAVYDRSCTNIFSNDSSITSVIITDRIFMNTSGIDMFSGCIYVKNMDLSKLDTSNVTDMSKMFSGCTLLTSLDVSNWDTSNVTNMSKMFSGCTSLTNLDVSDWNTSIVRSMENMFSFCSSLTSLDVSNWDISNVMSYMFSGCSSLTSLDVSNWDTSNVEKMDWMFNDCSFLTNLDVSNWDTSNVTDMNNMFLGCTSLTSLDVSNWDTTNVNGMRYMFRDCSSLTSLDVSNWDTSKVTLIYGMFSGCTSLTSLDVSNWDTSNVKNMKKLFYGCMSLPSLDVSNWDTSNMIDMSEMFSGCSSLKHLDVSNWDTFNVSEMVGVFSGCTSLTSLDVSNWNTSNVTDMSEMFSGCSSLHILTLGRNTLEQNIFQSLHSYNDTWCYFSSGPSASSPLPLGTAKENGELFTGYDFNTMAGTWSVDSLLMSLPAYDSTLYNFEDETTAALSQRYSDDMTEAKAVTPKDISLNNKNLGAQFEITALEYNDGNLLQKSVDSSDTFYLEIKAVNATDRTYTETVKLPAGLSFSDKTYEQTKEITLGGKDSSFDAVKAIKVYSVYHPQSVESIKIEATGDENIELIIPVVQGAGTITINKHPVYSNHDGPYMEPINNIGVKWDSFPKGDYDFNEALLALDLSYSSYETKNIKNALHNLGFTKIEQYDSKNSVLETDPFRSTHYIAQKKVAVGNNIKTVIAVVIRGTDGKGEWVGNFMSAFGIDSPSTFLTAANNVYDHLGAYVKKYGISQSDAIPFVCGHSRAGAAADIVAYKINSSGKWYDSVTYTYAAANNRNASISVAAEYEKNIYNYEYARDLTMYVPQGSVKYGNTYVVGYSATPAAVSRVFNSYTEKQYNPPDNSIFISMIINLFKPFKPLAVKDVQTDDQQSKINDANLKMWESLKKKLEDSFSRRLSLPHSFENYNAWLQGNRRDNAKPYMDRWNPIDSGDISVLNRIFHTLVNLDQEIVQVLYDKCVSKLFNNVSLSDFNSVMNFNLSVIQCPVDIKLYDQSDNVVASIVDHRIEFVNESDDYFAFTDGENDYVFYPENSGYSLKIVGNDDGTINIETTKLGADFEMIDNASIANVPVSNHQKYSLNIVEDNLQSSSLESEGIEDPGNGTHVFIIDNDLLTKTIDLGTSGESWENLTYQLSALVRPAGKNQTVTWKSSNSTIAEVDSSGLVTGKKDGTVVITATAADGSNASASVTLNVVTRVQPGNIVINGLNPVGVGNQLTLSAEISQNVKPKNQNLVWTTDNPEIATVTNNGIVTGVQEGTALITVCPSGSDQYCSSVDIQVLDAAKDLYVLSDEGLNITGMTVFIESSTYQLKARPEPYSASHVFTWSSSDQSVAEVDDAGLVKFLKGGTITVIAAATDGSGISAWVNLNYSSPSSCLSTLSISQGNVLGVSKGIDVKAARDTDAEGYSVSVYDIAQQKTVKPTVKITHSGTNTTIKLSGDVLINGNVYKLTVKKYKTVNETKCYSNTVTVYGMPHSVISKVTAQPIGNGVRLDSEFKTGVDGTRYYVYDAATGAQVKKQDLTGPATHIKLTGLENGKLYYSYARPYRIYNNKYILGPKSKLVYYVPVAMPGGVTVQFSDATTAVISTKENSEARGVRVLYREPGGSLKNGCVNKGNQCSIGNLSQAKSYEFYVMHYNILNDVRHYGSGITIRYNPPELSTLPRPTGIKVHAGNPTWTFSITKSSDAAGISVLYRINEGNFALACEKAGASCTKDLTKDQAYTFFIMQYKLVDGKKVYSPGATVKNLYGTKSADEEIPEAAFVEVEESFDTEELYAVLEDYLTEEDMNGLEAMDVIAMDGEGEYAVEPDIELYEEEDLYDLVPGELRIMEAADDYEPAESEYTAVPADDFYAKEMTDDVYGKAVTLSTLSIAQSSVLGYNGGIEVKTAYDKNATGYSIAVYDVVNKKTVKPTIDKPVKSGSNVTIKIHGDSLVNGNIYKLTVYKYNTNNGTTVKSNTVTVYGMPHSVISKVTAQPIGNGVRLDSEFKTGTNGTRYYVYDAATGAQVKKENLTGPASHIKITGLENGKLYYSYARPYKIYNNQYILGPKSKVVYYAPVAMPSGVSVQYTDLTTAVISVKENADARGVRVLYREAGGNLKNGCVNKGNQCSIGNLSQSKSYEFYVMHYNIIDGIRHYGSGITIRTNVPTLSTLPRPTGIRIYAGNPTWTFSITKDSAAQGLSVLYRINEGNFALACEKDGASCTKDLTKDQAYTFFIMQYKLVDGKKVYSPGATVKNLYGTKTVDGGDLLTEFVEAEESINSDELYGILEDYLTEDDVNGLAAQEIVWMEQQDVYPEAPEMFEAEDGYDMVPEELRTMEITDDYVPTESDFIDVPMDDSSYDTEQKGLGIESDVDDDPVLTFYGIDDGTYTDVPYAPSFINK